MKKFKLTKGIQIILITLLVTVVGAIIVGILSKEEVLASFSCTGCGGTGYTISYTNDGPGNHWKYYWCNSCGDQGDAIPETCTSTGWSPSNSVSNTHADYCKYCHYAIKTGTCYDNTGDGNCDVCGGSVDGGGGSGGGGSTEGLEYDWFDSTIHHIYKDGDWYSYEKHTSSSWTDQGNGTHWALCNKCGGAATLEHTEVTVPAVAATCTTPGKTAGKKCSDCGAIIQAQQDIPAGHTEVDIGETVEATCTTEGSKGGKKCSVCGEITQQPTVIPAKGHTEVEIPAVAATCTTAGKTAGKKCSVCGVTTKAQTTVAALGHNYEDGECTECGQAEPITEIEITSTKYKIEGTYIYVQPSTKVSDFKSNITTNATEIKVYGNDVEVSNDTTIATGMSLELKNGDINKIFTIIVKGDVNSDGLADFKDLVKINKARLSKITLEEMYFLAADVNEDESVDLKDLSKINRFRLNKITEL